MKHLFATVIAFALAGNASADTFCNPLNLPYRWALNDNNQTSFREAADPTMLVFKGEYYLFASRSGGYFHSTDLLHWTFITTPDLPIEGYAPTAVAKGDEVYFTCSLGGEIGTRAIWKTSDPKTGRWTRISGAGTTDDLADPMLFWDDDLQKMYLYYGSSGDPNSYIQVMEMNPATMKPIGNPVNLLSCSMDKFGWEVPGDYNDLKTGRNPWLEGAWVDKYDGKYYLQYSAPGTEMKAYNDGVYVADSPTGPFVAQEHNPMSYRPEGFITAAGHGSTFQDIHGNYWHISTGTISRRYVFERRLVMYPVFFDADGTMWSYTAYGDWPMKMPDSKVSSPQELRMPWQLLSYGKPVTASSAADGFPATNAVNEDIRTWWSAATANAGEYIMVDLGDKATVNALQVNFADEGAVAYGIIDNTYKYKVELSADGIAWTTPATTTSNTAVAPHDYLTLDTPAEARYVKITNVECPYGKFSMSGLRVFGTMDKELPAKTQFTAISRSADDARSIALAWERSEGAVGYNVRYGTAADKLYHNYTVYGSTQLTINSLSADATYHFTIDAFNEAGETLGTEVKTIAPGDSYAIPENHAFFPLTEGGLDPKIFGDGTYNAATHELITGQYGFGGWQYSGNGIDLSKYDTLHIELGAVQTCGAQLRLYDNNTYWSDPAIYDLGAETSHKVDLASLKHDGDKTPLDLSHIYIVGFWSYGGAPINIKSMWVSYDDTSTAIGSVKRNDAAIARRHSAVYSLSGVRLDNPRRGLNIGSDGRKWMGK